MTAFADEGELGEGTVVAAGDDCLELAGVVDAVVRSLDAAETEPVRGVVGGRGWVCCTLGSDALCAEEVERDGAGAGDELDRGEVALDTDLGEVTELTPDFGETGTLDLEVSAFAFCTVALLAEFGCERTVAAGAV